ncbi:MAG: hypothetical protein H6577_03930 [Lewinellaceae bacterium]|nr:hypothetical protein [Saprospiraceae bacterium]MCB9337253.1 hypothetical protein [Lewinellaceae bacterium]
MILTCKKSAASAYGFQNNPHVLYEKLRSLDASAISFLHQKTKKHINFKRHLAKATLEDAEELANDTILMALQKITNGTYVYQGYSPLTFTLVIADNLLRNFCRKKRIYSTDLEGIELPEMPEVEVYLTRKELEEKIEKMLDKISPIGRQVIRLKYFENLKDEEVVERKLTPYTTVDSLKTKRCAYLRILKRWVFKK